MRETVRWTENKCPACASKIIAGGFSPQRMRTAWNRSLQIGDPLAELMLRRASFVVDGEREVDNGQVLYILSLRLKKIKLTPK